MDLFKSTDNWTTLSTDDNIVFEEQTVEGSSAHRLRTKGTHFIVDFPL
jgi:hypothetical protein